MKMFLKINKITKCDRDINTRKYVLSQLTDLHRSVRVVTNLQSVKKQHACSRHSVCSKHCVPKAQKLVITVKPDILGKREPPEKAG